MEIKIFNFKNLKEITFPLTNNISLLVGGNNAGKSSILHAIQFGISVMQSSGLQKNSRWKDGVLPTSLSQNQFIYSPVKDILTLSNDAPLTGNKPIKISYLKFPIKDSYSDVHVQIKKGKNKNLSIHITNIDPDIDPTSEELLKPNPEELLKPSSGELLKLQELVKAFQSLSNPFCILVTGLAGIQAEEQYLTPFSVNKLSARGNSNSVFRNILWLLKNKSEEDWGLFYSTINKIFKNHQISVTFNPNEEEYINCTLTKDGREYPIDSCGTGLLQTIQIFSYIYLYKPKILLLDEPDSHLHPNNQKLLAKELIEIANELDIKIIISTHSQYIIQELKNIASFLWVSDGKLKKNVDNYVIHALMEIGILSEDILNIQQEFIVLTEDSDTKYISKLIEANGINLDSIKILSYNGCGNIEAIKLFISYLQESAFTKKFIIHRDKDFMGEHSCKKYKDQFNELQNVKVFLTEGNDIESYFLNPKHIAKVLKISENKAEEYLSKAKKNRFETLRKAYTNAKTNEMGAKNKDTAKEMLEKSFDENNPDCIHGKTLLAGLETVIRDELKDKCNYLFSKSEYLIRSEIQELFTENNQESTATHE